MTRQVAVEIENVTIGYRTKRDEQNVLENVTLTVPAGQIVAIVGKSGVGKSSLLRAVAGLHRPKNGHIRLFGEEISAPPPGLGYVVQDYSSSLYPWLTVKSNITLAMDRLGLSKTEKAVRVGHLLESVGLSGLEGSFPWQLSGGMQQRVAIARALAGEPHLLLMDEPFASVDAHVRMELEDLTAELVERKGITTILITHDIDEAVYMAQRVVVLGGKPAGIVRDLPIPLESPRNQLHTRALPEFHRLRSSLHQVLGLGQEGRSVK
jgi:NitT/TauT family transport system ATP-binding protein